ncbi:hypothetical protein F8M41_021630 [Gigaspora margarita]|uniref:Uncharacterized protein n=1 Tax=Gigaspora margarita TaxID=4874 RepID=A0A8H4B1I1_GIGMA|nr:hypothetical protein F8M41_021630 [Gigaspora margarita]
MLFFLLANFAIGAVFTGVIRAAIFRIIVLSAILLALLNPLESLFLVAISLLELSLLELLDAFLLLNMISLLELSLDSGSDTGVIGCFSSFRYDFIIRAIIRIWV